MNNGKSKFDLILDNWKFIVVIFAIAKAYYDFEGLKGDVVSNLNHFEKGIGTVEGRLDKKIKILNQLDNRLDAVEKEFAVYKATNDLKLEIYIKQ